MNSTKKVIVSETIGWKYFLRELNSIKVEGRIILSQHINEECLQLDNVKRASQGISIAIHLSFHGNAKVEGLFTWF